MAVREEDHSNNPADALDLDLDQSVRDALEEFEEQRQGRMSTLIDHYRGTNATLGDMLADLANLSTFIYVNLRVSKDHPQPPKQGFQSFSQKP